VISLKPLIPQVYKRGFKNPSGGRPWARRASFRRATKAAKVGEDAEVPPIDLATPWWKMRNRRPCAATSGKAYPVIVSGVLSAAI